MSEKPFSEWFGITITDSAVTKIDLPRNNLSGEIPTIIGGFESIKVLNLSDNNLFGELPVQLNNLNNLQELDLSHNKFKPDFR